MAHIPKSNAYYSRSSDFLFCSNTPKYLKLPKTTYSRIATLLITCRNYKLSHELYHKVQQIIRMWKIFQIRNKIYDSDSFLFALREQQTILLSIYCI